MPTPIRWLMLATTRSPTVLRLWRGTLVLLLLAILWLALTPEPPRTANLLWDKTNHLLAFASLGLVASLGVRQRPLAVMLGLLAYGGLIELLQALTPTRTGDWQDLLADGLGIALGQAVAAAVLRWTARRSAADQPPRP